MRLTDTRSATAPVSARRCKLKVVATQSKETERGAVSCIAWLGRFGTRGERSDVSLFQITLQAFELLVIPDFRNVCDAAPIIGTNFEEESMSTLLSKMNSYSYCISHHHQVDEDTSAAQEDVSLTGDNLDLP